MLWAFSLCCLALTLPAQEASEQKPKQEAAKQEASAQKPKQEPPKAEAPKLIAITNVTVIDVQGGGAIPGQTVLIAEGKIVLVGNPNNMGIPKYALKISGRGKFLIDRKSTRLNSSH